MQSVDVPVALLGYGTVGAAVHRLLTEQADEIERATGHRLRVVRARPRPVARTRLRPGAGVLTTDVRDVLDDPTIRLLAEVMGGVDPAGDHVLALLGPAAPCDREQAARRAAGAELFAAAATAGAQLRFEASVCAAIPVIKVLRESLVVINVHRVLGIVNGTTNFILTAMGEGSLVRRRARRGAAARVRRGGPDRRRGRAGRGCQDGDPRDGRVRHARAARLGRGGRHRGRARGAHRGRAGARHAREAAGRATFAHGRVDVRVGPPSSTRTIRSPPSTGRSTR